MGRRGFLSACCGQRCAKVLFLSLVLTTVFIIISNSAYYLTVKSCFGLSSADFHLYCKMKAPVQQSSSMEELKNAVIGELVHLQKDVSKAWMHSRGGIATQTLLQAHTRLEKLMSSLDENYLGVSEHDANALVEKPPQDEKPYVCDEVYRGTTFDYPEYRKGWDLTSCTGVPALNQVVTVLLNLQNIPNANKATALILSDLEKVYPQLTVLISTSENIDTEKYNLSIKLHPISKSPGLTWTNLITQVTTPYLLIGRDIERITSDIRLERLIRVAQSFDVDVVGGAIRTLNGHWSSACHQFTLRNYTLAYIEGYDVSRNACMYCEHLTGPFLARTEAMQKIGFFMLDHSLSADVLFEDFFISLKRNDKLSMSCPDSMFLTHNHESRMENRLNWLPLVKKHEINHIHLYHGKILQYTCEEADTPCKPRNYKGLALPICCAELLAKCLNAFFKLSDERKMITESGSGNLLGSVKFGGILPWERDADADYLNSNHSVVATFKEPLASEGCILEETKDPIKDEYGYYALKVASWRIELWGTNRISSEKDIAKGFNVTRVLTHGYWQPAPFNPAYYSRARYGYEVFKHVQHWQTLKEKNSWLIYKAGHFTPCPKPGHHSCLDSFLADGNIHFKIPW